MYFCKVLTLFGLISSLKAYELMDVMFDKVMVDLTNKIPAVNKCFCRDLCYEDEICFAYTWIPKYEGVGMCYTSNDVSVKFSDAVGTQSVSGLKLKPLHEDVIANAIQGLDGLYYWIPTTDKKNFSEAESLCGGRLHSFQLGIYKNLEQYEALETIVGDEDLGETWVNIHYDSDMNARWSDGTLYSEADTGAKIKADGTSDQKFRFRPTSSIFNDRPPAAKYSVLCQYKPNI